MKRSIEGEIFSAGDVRAVVTVLLAHIQRVQRERDEARRERDALRAAKQEVSA